MQCPKEDEANEVLDVFQFTERRLYFSKIVEGWIREVPGKLCKSGGKKCTPEKTKKMFR